MNAVPLKIDGRDVAARQEMSILAAAQSAGISIPTLCHHDKLKPFGGCRLCLVEAEAGGRTKLVCACTTPVEKDLAVRTRSAQIDKSRRLVTEMLLAAAPESELLLALARDYQADEKRFPKQPTFCILCGRCVRYCTEVKRKNALGMVGRGQDQEIAFVPEIAVTECWDCRECFPLCPTSALQAAFVLANSLSESRAPGEAASPQSAEPNSVAERHQPDGSPVAGDRDCVSLLAAAEG